SWCVHLRRSPTFPTRRSSELLSFAFCFTYRYLPGTDDDCQRIAYRCVSRRWFYRCLRQFWRRLWKGKGINHNERQPRWSLRRCRSEEHTSELQSRENLVCRLL